MTLSLTWQLSLYDRLINLPSNDWEIYYWVTGAKDTPKEFDHTIFDILEEQKSSENPELKRATNYTKNIVSLNHFWEGLIQAF